MPEAVQSERRSRAARVAGRRLPREVGAAQAGWRRGEARAPARQT